MMPLSMRALSKRINFCKLHTFSFFGPVSAFVAQEGPERVCFALFSEAFSDARVYISPTYLFSKIFFCDVKKVRSKYLIRYAAWGLPQGPAFACTLTISNKTKK